MLNSISSPLVSGEVLFRESGIGNVMNDVDSKTTKLVVDWEACKMGRFSPRIVISDDGKKR